MKLKKMSKEEIDNMVGILDNEDLGYMILHGGMSGVEPLHILDNEEDAKRVNEAIKTLQEFERALPDLS